MAGMWPHPEADRRLTANWRSLTFRQQPAGHTPVPLLLVSKVKLSTQLSSCPTWPCFGSLAEVWPRSPRPGKHCPTLGSWLTAGNSFVHIRPRRPRGLPFSSPPKHGSETAQYGPSKGTLRSGRGHGPVLRWALAPRWATLLPFCLLFSPSSLCPGIGQSPGPLLCRMWRVPAWHPRVCLLLTSRAACDLRSPSPLPQGP